MSTARRWMATKRRTLDHHLVHAGTVHTTCGRYVGKHAQGQYGRGIVVDEATAAALAKAQNLGPWYREEAAAYAAVTAALCLYADGAR